MLTANEFLINGIVPIIPTPFTVEEQIDWPSLRRLVDFACATGACAMCLPAYASEFYKLSERERLRLVAETVQHAAGRIPVFAQVNFVSLTQAVETAREAQKSGASAIAAAVPRMLAFGEPDLYRYFDRLLSSIEIPLLIQDVNPSGPTVTARFVAELHRARPHFRWIKLEEPMMSSKVSAILEATNGEVGVLEGWGGMYMLDLIPAGICGVMPGLAISDLLVKVFQLATTGDTAGAYKVHEAVLPQIVLSLQHMELFHHAEKRLLVARGLLHEAVVRQLTLKLDRPTEDRIAFLNQQILALLDRLELPRNPLLPAMAGQL
ncbi:MAG TPA: dihydrodipicolinate synthase family protein [Bryobacteraceae bacterium]|nr:dihydrodipicolinate synthase family protein [Bryobacteraceae bacterium]